MEGFDYSYYSEGFGGKASEAEFKRYAETACDVVSLLIGKDVEMCSDTAVLRALCAQVEYLAFHTERDRGITRESIGDYAVSYGRLSSADVSSLPVSPESVTVLTRAGLLTRWA